jgi:hypothetical protein
MQMFIPFDAKHYTTVIDAPLWLITGWVYLPKPALNLLKTLPK